ncbi:MAG: serine hydrolase [Candidatus Bathyarchaeota archaeon]|nr:serine hydrolase [Candidatus Bathyarchaeota archaeon]
MIEDFKDLEGFILEKMSETKLPGLSIAIVEGDKTIYTRGFGFRDLSSGLPATPRTLYGIGSVTKSFTALAIMQLVEEGKINLDDPVEKFVPIKLKPFGETVSIHNLLTHSLGVPALAYAEAFIRGVLGLDHFWLPVSSPEDIIAFMRNAEKWAVAKPGTDFFYLNEGYVLLGYIISKLSGVRYEEYIRKRILAPLKMSRTFFLRSDVENDQDRAAPYIIDKEGQHVASTFPFGITSDGGLISNVIDLASYLKMHIDRGKFGETEILSNEMLGLMEKTHIQLPYQIFGRESYGYGWMITPNFHGGRLVGHGGSVLVYTAYVGYMPEKKIGVALLANASGYLLSHVGNYALSMLLGIDPGRLPFIKSDRILRKLQGEYETYKGTMRASVKKKGDFLYMEIKDRYTEEILPLVPEKLEDGRAIFYTLSGGSKYTADFKIEEDKIVLIYERYKLVKKV